MPRHQQSAGTSTLSARDKSNAKASSLWLDIWEMVRVARSRFEKSLVGAVVHGSAVTHRLGPYSDIDVLLICKTLPACIYSRDLLAEDLKRLLSRSAHPFSFDFCTSDKLSDNVRKGHPFLCRIIDTGIIVYDTRNLNLGQIRDAKRRATILHNMAENFVDRARWHLAVSETLLSSDQPSACLFHSNFVFQCGARAYLLKREKNATKGEILQLFIRETDGELDSRLQSLIWSVAFPLNQAVCRVIEPSFDIPLLKFAHVMRVQAKHFSPPMVIAAARQFLEFITR
jgi:predicted nucleotidyltransferase